jgi:hypothetical protein
MASDVRVDEPSRTCRAHLLISPTRCQKRVSLGLSAKNFVEKPLRAKTNFLNAFNVIWPVQSSPPHSLAIVSLRAHFRDQTQHVIVENMSNLVDIGIAELPKLR